MHARPFIDSLDFARNGQQISGEVRIADLLRLSDILTSSIGQLRYSVLGGVDRQGCSWLEMNATGMCQLRCQRCLRDMAYEIQLDSHLLLRDQAGLDALSDDEEEFDSVLAEARLDLLSLLEEEILLSLPFAPKHDQGDCQMTSSQDSHKDIAHPFAALAKLKNR
jgi:uncharacterized protein